MEVFLTSSPCLEGERYMCECNGFVSSLRRAVRPGSKAVIVSSAPDDEAFNRYLLSSMKECFEGSGIALSGVVCLDRGNAHRAPEIIREAQFIVLAGGHVPTQNRFFLDIDLKSLISGWDGVIMGCSAGSMNAADPVFVQPEEPGEGIDPDFPTFLTGLGLTRQNVVPHYQKVKDYMLDGKRLFEDLIYAKSYSHPLWAIPDGTYIHSKDGKDEELRGEAWLILDGQIRKFQEQEQITRL